ncbi:degenerin mec-10-like [Amblyomma americanum]
MSPAEVGLGYEVDRELLRVFLEYGRFPVAINYNFEEETDMHFPGVTLCNVNPMKRFFSKIFMNRYGNCLCFHCNSSRNDDAFYAYESTLSPENGLVLVLDVQASEYLPTSAEMGFFVMVHGHEYQADPCDDGDFVEPGYATYIGIHLTKRMGLPEPYEHPCRSEWPPHLENFVANGTTYTKEDCLRVCLQSMIRERCKCESSAITSAYQLPADYTYPICESSPTFAPE